MGRIENYIRAKWSEAYDFVEKMKRIGIELWDKNIFNFSLESRHSPFLIENDPTSNELRIYGRDKNFDRANNPIKWKRSLN